MYAMASIINASVFLKEVDAGIPVVSTAELTTLIDVTQELIGAERPAGPTESSPFP